MKNFRLNSREIDHLKYVSIKKIEVIYYRHLWTIFNMFVIGNVCKFAVYKIINTADELHLL